MFQKIHSSYGQDPTTAVKTISGYASLEAFAEFVISLLENEYGLMVHSMPALHIGFGLAVEVETTDASYFLKFSSLEAHRHPDDLIAWWAELQVQNYPIPHIIRAKNWKWYLTPWEGAVVYLMTKLPGKPRMLHTERTLNQYIQWMAAIHSWGEQYPHENRGDIAAWNQSWNQRHTLLKTLESFVFLDHNFIAQAAQEIEPLGSQTDTQVIVHGDFRLCHVLYEGEELAGIIDFDQSTQGERWIDLCYGLISGVQPHSGSQLTFEQVRYALQYYNTWLKIPADEQAALKAHFAYAGLETLAELAKFHQRGALMIEEIRKTETLLQKILAAERLI